MDAKDPDAYAQARRISLPQAETLVKGLRDSVAAIGAQAELAQVLMAKGISGSKYIEEGAAEAEMPLLVFPS